MESYLVQLMAWMMMNDDMLDEFIKDPSEGSDNCNDDGPENDTIYGFDEGK